jgi:hypothetical protein
VSPKCIPRFKTPPGIGLNQKIKNVEVSLSLSFFSFLSFFLENQHDTMPRLPTDEDINATNNCSGSMMPCCFTHLFSRKQQQTSISADEEKSATSYKYSAIPTMDHLPAYEDCISRVRYILSTG